MLPAALLLALAVPPAGECYTVIAGARATADGSVLLAHNEDDQGDILVNLRRIQPRSYPGPVRTALNAKATFQAPAQTQGFFWIEATTQPFADAFVNDSAVVVVSNSCPSRETAEDLTDGGIDHMLRRVVAEQATSARHAVEVAGRLIQTHGYAGSGRTYSFADPREAWMLSVVKGRHWVARRVPDDQVVVLPNHYILREVDLSDTRQVMASPGLLAHAQARGFHDPATRFDFAAAFRAQPKGDLVHDGNTLRQWRGLERLTGTRWEVTASYPWSVKPARRVTEADLMALLRDHYEGTPHDLTGGHQTGTPNATSLRTICTRTTIHALVARLRADLPGATRVRLQLALAKPDTTAFVPFYPLLPALPAGLGLGSTTHDYDRMWAEHLRPASQVPGADTLLRARILEVERTIEADYPRRIEAATTAIRELESTLQAHLPLVEAAYRQLPAREADEMLARFQADTVVELQGLTARLKAIVEGRPSGDRQPGDRPSGDRQSGASKP